MKILKNSFAFAISVIMTMSIIPVHAAQIEESHSTGLPQMTNEAREELENSGRLFVDEDTVSLYNLQTNVDNSDTIYFPTIVNQGGYGACTLYSTTYYQMTYTISKALNKRYTYNTFNPLWTFSLTNDGENHGVFPWDAYKILEDFGAPKQTEFTGTAYTIETKASVWESAMKYKLDPDNDDDNWSAHEFSNTDLFIESAKAELANGKVLTTGTNAYWWYSDSVKAEVTKNGKTKEEKGIAYVYNNGGDGGAHFITIVGYDDNVKMSYNGYTTTGAFKIANSWGNDWGNNGYMWVAYDAFYRNSNNRPSDRQGKGFISSWWGTDGYYTIDLDDNYTVYTPQYVGEFTLNNKEFNKMNITYKSKINEENDLSEAKTIFDGPDYDGLSGNEYKGTVAFDLSNMSEYFGDETSWWEIYLNGIDVAKLRILNSKNSVYYALTEGNRWVQKHDHLYKKGEVTYGSYDWSRIDTCTICDVTKTVTGSYYYYDDFEDGIYSNDWGNNGRGVISSVTEDNNSYMKIDYVNESGERPTYFEIFNPRYWLYRNTLSGPMEMSFDVKFDGNDSDVYLRRRSEDINDIVLRIGCKERQRLQYGTNNGRRTFYDKDGNTIDPTNRWLHIQIVANISEDAEEAKQTIYVTDKTSGELLSTVENVNLAKNVPYVNVLYIGGSSTVNIDNIMIREDQ